VHRTGFERPKTVTNGPPQIAEDSSRTIYEIGSNNLHLRFRTLLYEGATRKVELVRI